MSKTASTVVYVIIFVLALFFCVGSCLPGGLSIGEYKEYNSAINLIQGDGMFSDVQQTAYKVKLDEDANINDVAATIRARLADMYGYYFSKVVVEDNTIVVNVPVTANSEKTGENSVLNAVTSTGKVEFLSSSTYSESDVVFTSEHVKSVSTRRYSSSTSASYIVNVKLNAEGKELAASKLKPSTSNYSAYVAVDGTVSYGATYNTNGTLQIYTSSENDCAALKGLIKNGALGGKLVEIPVDLESESNVVKSYGGLIFAILMAVVIVASWVFYFVRYGKISLAVVLSQLIAVTVFIIFAGLVYFNLLNVASAIGILGGYVLMSAFSCVVLEGIKNYADRPLTSAKHLAFRDANKWNLIVHAIVLVAGIILWLIPTGVTAPLGNALVYGAVLSFVATMGLNRLFAALVAPLC